jgi:hypothetical protein
VGKPEWNRIPKTVMAVEMRREALLTSLQQAMDQFGKVSASLRFRKQRICTCLFAFPFELTSVVDCKKNHWQGGHNLSYLPRCFQSVHLGHPKIQDGQVRVATPDLLHGLHSGCSFSTYFKVRIGFKNRPDLASYDLAVVGHQNTFSHLITVWCPPVTDTEQATWIVPNKEEVVKFRGGCRGRVYLR